jgi:hypothetical protein
MSRGSKSQNVSEELYVFHAKKLAAMADIGDREVTHVIDRI